MTPAQLRALEAILDTPGWAVLEELVREEARVPISLVRKALQQPEPTAIMAEWVGSAAGAARLLARARELVAKANGAPPR